MLLVSADKPEERQLSEMYLHEGGPGVGTGVSPGSGLSPGSTCDGASGFVLGVPVPGNDPAPGVHRSTHSPSRQIRETPIQSLLPTPVSRPPS